ncbi:hypothetical protein [Nocardioides sp. GY 10127]|uniref:hypothetical protein n=1 Tax=Nocardioides sp. GY 10127 TaxID=2569762 RepID=UPI0010A928B5|nr:hypothetical protein [Nocardioides sp. GY 10127]TIC82784.1 hypothetical protein E8D37_08870 [Nocardioides sp. GY 10127]
MLSLLAALGLGGLSAVVPVVNAEALAAAAGGFGAWQAVGLVLALALGQSTARMVLFEAGRRGSARCAARSSASRAPRARHRAGSRWAESRWAGWTRERLSCRGSRSSLVLASAAVGLPPLTVISVAAGAAQQPRWEFWSLCVVGRIVRFGVLAVPAVLALA